MEIVLLGTGAALPTKSRLPSATALIRRGEILLFDCGEGTQIQFQKAQLKPGKLTRIFISHFHGDHFYGLIGLLTSLQLGGRAKQLFLYGPKGLSEYLSFMQQMSLFTLGYPIQICEVENDREENIWDFDEYSITALPLEHRILTLGFRLEEKLKPGKFVVSKAEQLDIPDGPLRARLQNGQSVVLPNGKEVKPAQVLGPKRPGQTVAICLDSKPCQNSIELARNADLLIHEATFDDSRKERADETYHSTGSQAAQIAKESEAKKLLLNHISARYEKNDEEEFLTQATKIFPNTILGQDLMRVQV